MDRDELLALADRCEKAVKPDKVLNRAIARAVGWGYQTPSEAKRKSPAWFHPDDCRDGKPVFDSLHGTDVWREPSQYVFSLDAAMTLVPGGWCSTVADYWCEGEAKPPCFADCGDLERLKAGEDAPVYQAWAQTKPLALCAAGLRGKASQ